jgi:hypothetical protein
MREFRRMADDDRDETYKAFKEAVNVTAPAPEKWLDTRGEQGGRLEDEDGDGTGESAGHECGRRMLELLGRRSRPDR